MHIAHLGARGLDIRHRESDQRTGMVAGRVGSERKVEVGRLAARSVIVGRAIDKAVHLAEGITVRTTVRTVDEHLLSMTALRRQKQRQENGCKSYTIHQCNSFCKIKQKRAIRQEDNGKRMNFESQKRNTLHFVKEYPASIYRSRFMQRRGEACRVGLRGVPCRKSKTKNFVFRFALLSLIRTFVGEFVKTLNK